MQTMEIEQQRPNQAEYVEQSASMMQQLAQAQIQSRYLMALRRPRNMDDVRQRMLRECERPAFCAPDENKNGSSIAIYRVPRGGNTIEDVTIRFAEMAMRCYGNMSADTIPLGEDPDKLLFQVSCTDYETNNTLTEIVIVPRTVERSYLKDTDVVVSQRTNSKGKPVFLITGTDDELQNKRNALFSKSKRNLIKAQIDRGLVDECKERIKETVRKKDAEDPDAAKRKLYDAFAGVGVTAVQLGQYLGHSNALNPAELEELRGFYAGIREGYTTWREIMESREEGVGDENLSAKIETLLEASGRTVAQSRNFRSKYAGQPKKAVEYLEEEAKKKAETSAQPQQSAINADAATVAAHVAPHVETRQEEKPAAVEAKPEPAKQQEPTKATMPPALNPDADW